MKIIYIILFFLAYLPFAKGQETATKDVDYCSLIKKDTSSDKITFNFSSPYDQYNVPPVRIYRNYSIDKENPYDNFNIIFQVVGGIDDIYNILPSGEKEEKIEKSIIIEFGDHSKISDDSISINHDFTDDKTQSIRYVYYPVTDDNFKDFNTKKIVKFSLAGYAQTVPDDSTNSFQKYLQCIKAVK